MALVGGVSFLQALRIFTVSYHSTNTPHSSIIRRTAVPLEVTVSLRYASTSQENICLDLCGTGDSRRKLASYYPIFASVAFVLGHLVQGSVALWRSCPAGDCILTRHFYSETGGNYLTVLGHVCL